MKFIGIDLGTTNSAIAMFDGSETKVIRSPEQNDVTPSAIYIDRRNNKYVGKRAYDSAPSSPNNSATLFKRFMGTSTTIELSAINLSLTPEECSAEVLKTLFGYLPEEVRLNPNVGTVITVPAAFNQMQKAATEDAARMAGIGNIALMQEPVAAVMSVMKAHKADGMFLIYDLGGGTLDIAIAESYGGRVNLLSHGGISMCGGRDFDRALMDSVIKPWLIDNFNLPDDLSINPQYKTLMHLAAWAGEKAKIELSSNECAVISLSENETRTVDLDGDEIYLDINISRGEFNELISNKVNDSIEAARNAMRKANINPMDMSKVVFVGGPTNYKPLRDKVCFELGMEGSTEVNPMTAVAEGASIFAESIDWTTKTRERKSSKGQLNNKADDLEISFNFMARTPDSKAKIGVKLTGSPSGHEFQIDSLDSGWTSGKSKLRNGAVIEVPLNHQGANRFKAFVFRSDGRPFMFAADKIMITRTAATIDAIPASYSIGVEVIDSIGGTSSIDYLVRSGDSLPAKGKKTFKAAETLNANSDNSLNIKIWEGEITDPVHDNRSVGVLKISGHDFDSGVIHSGSDLICEYEVMDSGNIVIEVSVPSIGSTFKTNENFYSRVEGQFNFNHSAKLVIDEGIKTLSRVKDFQETVDDARLDKAREKVNKACSIRQDETDPETTQEGMESILECKRILASVKKDNLKEIRQMELDKHKEAYHGVIEEHASKDDDEVMNSLYMTAERAIEQNDSSFENVIDRITSLSFKILWDVDWFVIEKFDNMKKKISLSSDIERFSELVRDGEMCVASNRIDDLREVIINMANILVNVSVDDSIANSNIMRV